MTRVSWDAVLFLRLNKHLMRVFVSFGSQIEHMVFCFRSSKSPVRSNSKIA
jgi:hypothetical protein